MIFKQFQKNKLLHQGNVKFVMQKIIFGNCLKIMNKFY